MQPVTIHPRPLAGRVAVPTSKSLAHRAIICASLAPGESVISDISMSKDIEATINAMRALGTTVVSQGSKLYINGKTTNRYHDFDIDCNESGSTLRFMIPVTLIEPNHVHFTGRGKLGSRPLDVYYSIFDKQEIDYSYKKDLLDLTVAGQLKPGRFDVPGNVSSQFISGLLFALPLLSGDSLIHVTTPLESAAYIELTLAMLKLFGISVKRQGDDFLIPGNQHYRPHDYQVEGDFSQAANYLVAGAIGNDVTITNLNLDSVQGDRAAISLLEEMGAAIDTSDGVRMKPGHLQCISIDAAQTPDIIPVIAVACALAQGTSQILNAGRLRLKECDRLHATCEVLEKCGVRVIEREDMIIISGVDYFTKADLSSYNDHRMAMMEAIMATRAVGDLTIDDAQCVTKSYPRFFEDYKKLGGSLDER